MIDFGTGSGGLLAVAPILTLAVTGFLVIVLELFLRKHTNLAVIGVTLAGLAAAGAYSVMLWDQALSAFGDLVIADNFSILVTFILLVSAVLSTLLTFNRYEKSYLLFPEFCAIVLFAMVGMLLMITSRHLLVIFLGLETLSISLYVLAGLKRTEARSLEAGFKYFLLGAFASAFLLYGIAFLFGATGSLDLQAIAAVIQGSTVPHQPLITLGALLILVGLGFKVAVFPFHPWAPDVYQGAPTPVAAFMSTASKAAAFAVILRVLWSATDATASDLATILAVVAVVTMTIGNVTALVQKNIKRMLAYSSVAHAGYILVGVASWNAAGAASVVFYLLAYTFMNCGAFAVVAYLGDQQGEHLKLDDFRGLAFRLPWLALAMAVFMFALAGLPPTAGFVAKFYLLAAAVKAGYVPVVILAVLNSVVSLYYYLGVVVLMFMKKEQTRLELDSSYLVGSSVVLAAIGALALGLFPSRIIEFCERVMSHVL